MIQASVLRRPYTYLFLLHRPSTTQNYTLSLHDALPIFEGYKATVTSPGDGSASERLSHVTFAYQKRRLSEDRKSTRLNSSHPSISYAVVCLKKKNFVKRFQLGSCLHLIGARCLIILRFF